MPVLGIGTDIIRNARFNEILSRYPHRFARLQKRILHPLEINEYASVSTLSSAWAAKEALYKSLPPQEQKQCRFSQWRKVFGPHGLELVCDLPRKDKVMLSISHDGEYTVAYVLRTS